MVRLDHVTKLLCAIGGDHPLSVTIEYVFSNQAVIVRSLSMTQKIGCTVTITLYDISRWPLMYLLERNFVINCGFWG